MRLFLRGREREVVADGWGGGGVRYCCSFVPGGTVSVNRVEKSHHQHEPVTRCNNPYLSNPDLVKESHFPPFLHTYIRYI